MEERREKRLLSIQSVWLRILKKLAGILGGFKVARVLWDEAS